MGSAVNVGIAVQADWENREFISNISLNVRRLFDFLLRFGAPPRSPFPSLHFLPPSPPVCLLQYDWTGLDLSPYCFHPPLGRIYSTHR